MASGTIALTRTGSGYLSGQIVWSSVSDGTVANTSTVTAQLQIQRSALNSTTGTFKGTFTVGSTSESISWYGTLPSKTWVTIKTITVTVSHNADGTGSCYLYAVVNGPTGTTMAGTYVSGSAMVDLDEIPRYASIVQVTDFTDEENPVISYSNPAGETVDILQACLSLDGKTEKIGYKNIPKNQTSYAFPLTEEERNLLRAATPNSNHLSVYVLLKTTIGTDTNVSSAKTQMNLANAHPAASLTVTDTNDATAALTGDHSILVAMHSTAQVTVSAEAKKYATIVSQTVEHGSASLSGDGTFSPVTNHPIKLTVTDSRGNTATQFAGNTIVPYFNPTCGIGNNLPETDGSFALVATGLFYNGAIGKTSNTLTVEYRYKKEWGSFGSWTEFETVEKQGNGYTATAILTGLDYQSVYTFQARVLDSVTAVASGEKRVIAEPVFDWGQNDFRFNVPVAMTKNGLGVYGETLPAVADADTCHLNGWYRITGQTVNGVGGSSVLRVDGYNSDHIVQTVYSGNASSGGMAILQRKKRNGIWSQWAWVNPLLITDQEYCTTELHNGEPVYMKRISFGNLPNGTSKNVSHGISGKARNLRCAIDTSSTNSMVLYGSGISSVIVNDSIIQITTNTDLSGINAYITLWYTKY